MIRIMTCCLAGLSLIVFYERGAHAQSPCAISSRWIASPDGGTYRANVRECSTGATELAANGQPARYSDGSQLIVVLGRAIAGQTSFFFRARPGISYPVRESDSAALRLTWSVARSPVAWTAAKRVLPFLPATAVVIGEADGYSITGYTDLTLLPSLASAAGPLKPSSIVVSVDGFQFSGSDDLAGYLTGDGNAVTDNRYVEVLYFDRNERPPQLRRTFVPVSPLVSHAGEWRQAAQAVRARSNGARAIATLGVLATFYALWSTWHSTGLAEWWREETERCRRAPVVVC